MATTKGISREIYQEAYNRLGTMAAVARELGVTKSTAHEVLHRIKADAAAKPLSAVGYNLNYRERTTAEAWDDHASAFERKIGGAMAKRGGTVRRSGPFCIAHFTDAHVDDDAAALHLLKADIEASHAVGAVMCHGGDLLNNWPLAGKLAKQWSEQSCTLPDALLRAQHYIEILKPDAWVDGNHEEMNPYLVNLFDQWIPNKTLKDYWRVDFRVCVAGGRDTSIALSHKFQKGSSWFNPAHGGVREMLEGEESDIYLEGHLHISGVMERDFPERGASALIVSSAGYKVVDKYATRISRGGKMPKIRGRAHWICVDPFAEDDETRAVAFKSARQAEAYLNGLQNLRTI